MGFLKRLCKILVIFVVAHALLLGGALVYLVVSGGLTVERVRNIVAVLRGEPAAPQASPEPPTGEVAASQPAPPMPGSEQDEVARLNFERMKTEATHRQVLASRAMVDLARRREEFEREKADQARLIQQQVREQLDQTRAAGQEAQKDAEQAFQKDLELLGQEKPKVALEHLLLRGTDEAAHLLLNLDARKGKKIIETAARDPANWARVVPVLHKIRDVAPQQAAELTANTSAGQGDLK